jgi:hypothetical protein
MSQATAQKPAKPKSSAEDHPVKISRSQGSRKASLKVSDRASGLSSYESIENQEQLSLFGKTSQELFATDLEMFSGAYPKSGVMQNGKLSAQPVLERHTLESESFSLPTPQAYSFQKSRRPGQTKLDGKLRSLLPTPSVCGNHNRKGASKTSGDGLITALQKLLPTPTAHLAKETGAPSEALRNQPTLHHILGLAPGQVLNPQFVEWMQGFPIGWTDLAL